MTFPISQTETSRIRTPKIHLRKKYLQRINEVKTARDYIEKVASISTGWGRPYLALPGDGLAYPTGDILRYELTQLESLMDGRHRESQ